MKETEFRIGNYCIDKLTNSILMIVGIREEGNIDFMVENRSNFPLQSGWQAEPIPLTKEWFLRFKFTKTAVQTYNKDFKPWTYQIEKHPSFKDGYIFFIDIHGVSAPPSIKIKYVHQLQNLYFALTGEELCPKP
jgi:hypothetical protein